MNSDFKELLQTFAEEKVKYLVVGGYAVIHYTQPRYTKHLDLWLEPSGENAKRVLKAFARFGIPLVDLTEEDFSQPGTQFNIGVSPVQLDFLTTVPGLEFGNAWKNRVVSDGKGFPIFYLGRDDVVIAKQTAGRLQYLADIEELGRADEGAES